MILDTHPCAAFVDKHLAQLISRVLSIMPIADHLKNEKMITDEKYTHVHNEKIPAEKMRILCEALEAGGPKVKAEFYKILKKVEPYLVEDLEAKRLENISIGTFFQLKLEYSTGLLFATLQASTRL
uniref:CARD domain-containing protein n=1 Tax=Astyanax mexicanus TaxID=7994 RepID=A0A3B1JCM8_ASTMX